MPRAHHPISRLLVPAASLATVIAAVPSASARQDGELPRGATPTETVRRAIDGRSLGGFVLPTQPIESGCTLSALRGWTWKVDDTQRLVLDGDVRVALGGYAFRSRRASIWINRLPTGGDAITQVAIWFEEADEPSRRAGLAASGRDLLVTASYRGATELSLLSTVEEPADRARAGEGSGATLARRAFVVAAEARLARHLRELAARTAAGTQALSAQPLLESPAAADEPAPVPGTSVAAAARDERIRAAARSAPLPSSIEVAQARALPIFEPQGTVTFSADRILIDEKADRVTVQGAVEIEYIDTASGGGRQLQLSAERGVLFLEAGSLAALREGRRTLEASQIEGLYLEGAVQATDGEYTMRGTRIYYDLRTNRAAIVDAVLRTYDRKRRDLPITVRAAELRQVAADQWTAGRATVSTSEFFTPHLAIGVDRVTVTKEPDDGRGGGGMFVNAEGAGIEAGGRRIVPLPGYEGRVDRIPIRSFEMGFDEDRGVEIGTSWDLPALLGEAPKAGLDAQLDIDGFSERGVAVGSTFRMSGAMGTGGLVLYGLYDTGGTDRLSTGARVETDAGFRGIVDGDWRTALSPTLTLQTQLAYISDETFVSAWREYAFNERREYETSVALNDTSANGSLELVLKHDLNDFISNSYLLASRGYTVDRLPDLSYHRYGDEPMSGLTWTQQWSAAALALRPTTGTPASLGVPVGAWGGAVALDGSLSDAYEAAGYGDGTIGRLDTRHEISIPMTNGSFSFAPFVVGQATGYIGDELATYTADFDQLRLQGGGGVRASVRFARVDDSVQSRLLDLNRLRHIIEPYATAWAGWDSAEAGSIPVYDQSIEGSSEGLAVNVGVRQTLQTQRGGAGAWRSVDWLKLDLGLVLNDGGNDFPPEPVDPASPFSSLRWAQSPIPAFYSFRPELSQWGSHVYGASTWQLSDALTIGGTANYLLDERDFITSEGEPLPNLARASVGLELRHNPVASSYLEYRYLAPTDTELLQAGVLYRLGKRYTLALSPQYDLGAGELRAASGSVTRVFPDFDMHATVGYDLIEDQTFVGFSLSIPSGSRSGVRSFGAYNPTFGGAR
ncbi:MAG: hypothetical protein RLZZ238_866 [Planctomycetota bacterium]